MNDFQQIPTRFLFRKDTLENWTRVNPILMDGELVIVTSEDKAMLKSGDGVNHFNDLPYVSGFAIVS